MKQKSRACYRIILMKKLPAPVSGRFVRLTVSHLSSITEGRFEYGLAEIEIFSKGENIAKGKTVTASKELKEFAWGGCKWTPELLTDGYLEPNHSAQNSLPIPPFPFVTERNTCE
ncbi:MAG: hypothetical protein LUD02_02435 [Tannerellaceae bacterium]|nr:hypothetical protein [Tannerellaceae bacterium]